MNKKGFTLIELLAVIVVLAIILLIAMPIVLNVINDAREGAFGATAHGMVKAAETEHMRAAVGGESVQRWYEFSAGSQTVYMCDTVVTECDNSIVDVGAPDLNFSGQGPEEGKIYVNELGAIGMIISDESGTFCSQKEVGKNTALNTTKAACPTSGALFDAVSRPTNP